MIKKFIILIAVALASTVSYSQKLFENNSDKMEYAGTKNLLEFKLGDSVNLSFTNNFTFHGIVIIKISKENAESILIKSIDNPSVLYYNETRDKNKIFKNGAITSKGFSDGFKLTDNVWTKTENLLME